MSAFRISSVVWWHAGFALTCAGVAVLLLVLGGMPAGFGLALAAASSGGIAGVVLSERRGWTLELLIAWAIGAGGAASLSGGVSGPLGVLTLMPVVAALLTSGRRRLAEGAALSVAAVATAALAQAADLTAAPAEPLRLWLTLFALVAVAGFSAAAVLLGPRDTPAAAPAARADPHAKAALAAAAARVRALEAERDDALAATRAKSRFLANMSHELRTPLNAVLGFSDTMRMRLFGPMPDRYAEYAELIHESGRHLLDLINDVLDMSKIEAERYELDRERFDAAEAAGAAVRLMRLQAQDVGVTLRSALPARPLEVDADRRALKQIVINLLSNALKFTPTGGTVTLSLAAADGALEVVVADTGVGIAPEDLDRLGRPYEQAGDFEQRARGTGLGLSLVRALTELHGGALAIESRLGEGTAVTVRLPVLAEAEVLEGPAPAASASTDNVVPLDTRRAQAANGTPA